jgi:hypothetical protein
MPAEQPGAVAWWATAGSHLRPVPLIIGVQLAAALQIIFSAVNINLISCRPAGTMRVVLGSAGLQL